ncbi:GspH/FimT family pseudopilin [Variovorax sp. ZT5P49]|uniref:GspH/FimT family pseudopilin n=1 Tax=Variovorax sp. ZT5P49 TaxID=3443733 RepID=UPI003F47106B
MNNGFCASERELSRRAERPQGFTLIEMMVVIALMTVLLAIALPSFNSLIERYRVEGMARALIASVSHARSEAVRRGKGVSIQQRAECRGGDWSCGWDTRVSEGTTVETLRRQDPDSRVAVERSAAGAMSFDAMGHPAGITSFSFRPAGSDDSPNAVSVCLSFGGRIRLVKGGGAC